MSNIPPFANTKAIETEGDKAGMMTPDQQTYQDNLNQVLQDSLSDNGWTPPAQPQANILAIAPSMPSPTFWVDDSIPALVFKTSSGLFQLPLTIPYP